jgi:hypothetical protein
MATTVKFTDEQAELLREARDLLLNQGLASLASLEVPCLKCGKPMAGVTLQSEHWHCPSCGNSQDGLKLGVGGALALGAVAGAGIVALLWWLHDQSKDG